MSAHWHDELDDEDDDVGVHHVPVALDLDDAFSDGEITPAPFHLTSEAIREDLAKHTPGGPALEDLHDGLGLDDDFVAKIGFAEDPPGGGDAAEEDDLGEPSHTGDLSPSVASSSHASLPKSPEDLDVDASFSQISLDDRPEAQRTPELHEPEPKAARTEPLTIHITPSPPAASDDDLPRISISSAGDALRTPVEAGPHRTHSAPPTTPEFPAPNFPVAIDAGAPMSPSLSLPLHDAPAPKTKARGHRPTRSVGPSMFEQVVSKTRPSFLPPKSKVEDNKHMADWQAMMKRSRAAEEKRRKALEQRRLHREKEVEDSLHMWQAEIVPDWKAVHKKPALRKLWWAGIPTALRAAMWERAVGNPLALSKDNYKTCHARARRALAAGTFPAATLGALEDDIAGTLPGLHIFHRETGPLYEDLRDMLCAWVVSRADEGLGYVPGVARIAGMFLINMPMMQAFVVMRNLLERHCMRAFYGGAGAKDDVEAYYRIFDTLLADGMPKIYFNFKQHQISPSAYLPDWVVPLFLDHLPFEACARLWDVILLEGDAFLYRAALAMLAVLEPRLFFPDRKELMELLRGENRAAMEVAKRDGRTLSGGRYEIYGVDEETLWERIDSMDEWWKESTWNRLLQRELPDI